MFAKRLSVKVEKFSEKLFNDIEIFFKSTAYTMVDDSRDIIKAEDRIDTGAMLYGVKAISSLAGITLVSDVTRAGKSESYASFNEYDNKRTGLKGIHFIGDSFKKNTDNIEHDINIIIIKNWEVA